jgi:hypothetical protein
VQSCCAQARSSSWNWRRPAHVLLCFKPSLVLGFRVSSEQLRVVLIGLQLAALRGPLVALVCRVACVLLAVGCPSTVANASWSPPIPR